MTAEKASVVIASHNNAAVLRRVLNGMLKLDYPKGSYEVIVVDDGSKDNTKEMMREFAGEKLIKFIPLPSGGVCKARNRGIREARFPIVINMDHDCIPEKKWLKKMVAGFKDEKTGVVSAYGHFGGTSTGFRKKILEKVGGYDEEYHYYREDTDLAFRVMEAGYEFTRVEAEYEHDHKMVKPEGAAAFLRHVLQRANYHMNDALLYKNHPNELCREFLNVKLGFIVSPVADFRTATGLWEGGGNKFELSSPRGITFLENKSAGHALAIILGGIAWVCAVKIARLKGSIKFGKLLI
ncbi:MAG: glycosyltransferase family A protein [archaeon]